MRGRTFALLLPVLVAGSGLTVQDPPPPAQEHRSLDGIIGALYDVISGPAGQKRDWDRFRSLFLPEAARLMPARPPGAEGGAVQVLTPEDYAGRAGPFLERTGFFETEIARRVERFGAVAHAFSTYESRRAAGEEPFQRGINSIQLVYDGQRWWVLSVLWDSERPGQPIPEEYLPKGP